jgi:hypothetical protein
MYAAPTIVLTRAKSPIPFFSHHAANYPAVLKYAFRLLGFLIYTVKNWRGDNTHSRMTLDYCPPVNLANWLREILPMCLWVSVPSGS